MWLVNLNSRLNNFLLELVAVLVGHRIVSFLGWGKLSMAR